MERNRLNALKAKLHLPLAEVMRPQNFGDYIGQEHLLNTENGEISNYLRLGYLPSMILNGPPGIGKTSLARLLAEEANYVFVELSATSSSIGEMRELVVSIEGENVKRKRHDSSRLQVLVFIDEIHRFSTVQQDFLLPYIESGAFVFVGATTVNPDKSIRKAILSRCRLFTLQKLSDVHIERVVLRAVLYENMRRKLCHKLASLIYSQTAIFEVVKFADGDMRSAVNLIELIGTRVDSKNEVDSEDFKENHVDKDIVLSITQTLSKARFGFNSERNIPLLRQLLKCLRYPQTNTLVSKANRVERVQEKYSEKSVRGAIFNENNSDSENWVDEQEYFPFTGKNPKHKAWAEHIPYSDDEEASPGPIYSEDEDECTEVPEVPDTMLYSASKFRILSATHACLQLLNKGESPLGILKYLILFTCSRTPPERNELINVISVLKAVRKSGTGDRVLLLNCIERLAGSDNYEPMPLRDAFEAANSYCIKTLPNDSLVNKEVISMKVDITYDDDLVTQLLASPTEDKSFPQLDFPIVLRDEIGPDYLLGDEDIDDFTAQVT